MMMQRLIVQICKCVCLDRIQISLSWLDKLNHFRSVHLVIRIFFELNRPVGNERDHERFVYICSTQTSLANIQRNFDPDGIKLGFCRKKRSRMIRSFVIRFSRSAIILQNFEPFPAINHSSQEIPDKKTAKTISTIGSLSSFCQFSKSCVIFR